MKRYLSLIFSFFRISLMQNFEYRLNFSIWAFVNVFWAGMSLLSVELIFGQISAIAGWTKSEVLLLVTIHILFVGIIWIFILPSLQQLSKLINRGDFDFYLLKPVSTRFLLSTMKFESDQYVSILGLLYVLFYFSQRTGFVPSLLDWGAFALLFVLGMFIFYNIFYVLFTTAFWLINIHNFEWFANEILNVGRFPVQVFKGGFKLIFFYVIPMGFVATFPTQMLLGRGNIWLIITGVVAATSLFVFSQWFWNFALKHYSSASS